MTDANIPSTWLTWTLESCVRCDHRNNSLIRWLALVVTTKKLFMAIQRCLGHDALTLALRANVRGIAFGNPGVSVTARSRWRFAPTFAGFPSAIQVSRSRRAHVGASRQRSRDGVSVRVLHTFRLKGEAMPPLPPPTPPLA